MKYVADPEINCAIARRTRSDVMDGMGWDDSAHRDQGDFKSRVVPGH